MEGELGKLRVEVEASVEEGAVGEEEDGVSDANRVPRCCHHWMIPATEIGIRIC